MIPGMSTTRTRIGNDGQGLAQVATRAEVSVATVSKVFNNSPQIPSETRIRVMNAARQLGVRPRVGVRSRQIALITEPPWKTRMGGYVNTLTQYVCFALSRADAGITMLTEDRIAQLSDCWFDGAIGVAWEAGTVERLKALHGVPVVWFSDMHADSFHSVCIDPVKTGRLAGDHLVGKGHRRIAVVHDPDWTGERRAAGVAAALRAQGADPDATLLLLPNDMPMHLVVQRIIADGCTAVWVTGEDLKVLEVSWLLQELAGRRIPEDISLLGFENPGISEFLRPSLSTVVSPLREMAERAVELVLRGPSDAPVRIELESTLIERNSVRRLA